MLLCKKLILIRGQPPRQGGSPRAALDRGEFTQCSEHLSQFPLVSPEIYVWSLLFCLCPFQSLYPVLSSRIKHNAFSRGQLLSSPSLAGSHTWCPVPPWFRVVRETDSTTPFNGKRARMGPSESQSGVWGILVHPSPPVQAYLQTTSFLGRISPVYTQGRRFLSSCWVVRPKS